MIHVCICDDEKREVNLLKDYVCEFFTTEKTEYTLSLAKNGKEILANVDEYDLIFLDIEFDQSSTRMNGVEVGERLRERNKKAEIIYVTNHEEYRLAAVRANYIGYIKKPVIKSELIKTMEKALSYLIEKQRLIKVKIDKREKYIRPSEIIYAKRDGRKVRIYVENDKNIYSAESSLEELEKKFNARFVSFVFIHKSYIVNMYHIIQSEDTAVTMRNGDILQIAKRRENEFNDQFSKFLGE